MNWNDMIYNEVYKQCKAQKCSELVAKDAAITALQKYKNGQYTKPTKLITESVAAAKKLVVKKRK